MSQLKVNSIVPSGGLPSGASGGIIQTVIGTTQTIADYNSNGSWSIITALDTSITVQNAGSKVLIMASVAGHNTIEGGDMSWKVYRNAGSNVEIDVNTSPLGNRGTGFYPNMRNNDVYEGIRWNYQYLDTHGQSASTSITYRFAHRTESNSFGLNYSRQNEARHVCCRSHVILMEVN